MNIPASVREAIATQLGISIVSAQAVSGGCIHNAREIKTRDRSYFLKFNHIGQLSNFQAEVSGLTRLKNTEEVVVPEVIGTGEAESYAWLVLGFVRQESRAPRYWEKLGWQLAALHRHTDAEFGLDENNFIGALPQQNGRHSQWLDFFREERIRPMLKMAVDRRELGRSTAGYFELLFTRIENFFPAEPPALLHGDLWGGNILTGENGLPVLIDPAVYYGHREAELAFMTLFDSIPQQFYEAYDEVYPLTPGFRDRFDILNLYPLLVHVNLFGGGYTSAVERILRRYI
ncbi:MAG: fructosamine kinase family protein [Bacteroidia bacterium]